MQSLAALFQILFVLLVPLRGAGIHIPADVIEARLRRQGANLGLGFFLQMHEADHHVGHLHAGVVNVVLHRHLRAVRSQQPHKAIAQDSVAQMPHVRRLVGIDAGVLH